MKKLYTKPMITFETLSLSSNISSGCAMNGTNSAEYICPVLNEETGWTIFSDNSVCMMVPGPNDTVCYHVPFANINIFDS